MKLRSLLFALALLSLTGLARAENIVLDVTQNGNNASAAFGNTLHQHGAFSDVFTFNTTGFWWLRVVVDSSALLPGTSVGLQSVTVNGVTLELNRWDQHFRAENFHGILLPSAGVPIQIVVNGEVFGSSNGYAASYIGAIALVRAVPEPSQLGMLGAGLLLMGFLVRRCATKGENHDNA